MTVLTLLQIDAPTVIDVTFGVSFILSGLALTAYLVRSFSAAKNVA